MLGQPIADNTYAGRGLVMRRTNDDLEREEAKRQSEATQTSPLITSLSGHVTRCWEANKQAKHEIEELLLKCLRQRSGRYDSEADRKI
jgi:hypothetical protein